MFKNVASQKIEVYAYDSTTGAPKTGDSANITVYVAKDFGSVTVLGDTTATEQDATNAKGLYVFDLTQAETNADHLQFSGKSSTSNIFIVPRWIETFPNRFTTLVIDAAGLADANAVKIGPTGAGTAQTARDIGASVITASGTVTTVTNQLTGAAIATAIWQDTTAGDFTTALSVGKSVMNGVALGTGLTVNDITTKTNYSLSGTQTFNVTGNITGNLSGSVGSVTGAVGSVTGAVGSVTGLTASNLDATISSRMATYTQPTGFLAATFPSGTVANTTNITSITGNITGNLSGSVGSVTGAVASVTSGVTVTTNSDKTGYALTSGERDSIANDVLDIAAGVETGWTLRQALRIMLSALSGKASGLATTSVVYRDMADTKNRISATVDSSGNRTAVTRDAT